LSPTTTTVTSSANPVNAGLPVTFTATAANSGPATSNTPSGFVTFKDGSTTLGTSKLNASSQATFTISSLSTGPHTITAIYAGDGNFSGSTSPGLTQTINAGQAAVIIANGQPGYSETGSWSTESAPGDYGGTDRYALAAGNGNNTATWQTSGLAAGFYTV